MNWRNQIRCASVMVGVIISLAGAQAFAEGIDVEITHDDILSGTTDRIDVTFMHDSEPQEYVTYTATITKDGQNVFGPTGLMYSSDETVGITAEFGEAGTYVMSITVKETAFRYVPETVLTFMIPVSAGESESEIEGFHNKKAVKSFMRHNPGYNEGLVHSDRYVIHVLAAEDRVLEMRYSHDQLVGKRYTCTDSGGDVSSFVKNIVKKIQMGCKTVLDVKSGTNADIFDAIRDTKAVRTFMDLYPAYLEDTYESRDQYEYTIWHRHVSLEIEYNKNHGSMEKYLTCRDSSGNPKSYEKNIVKKIKECEPAPKTVSSSIFFDKAVYPVPFGDDPAGSHFPYHDLATGSVGRGDVVAHVLVQDPYTDASDLRVEISRGSASVDVPVPADSVNSIASELAVPIPYDAGPASGCPNVFEDGCVLAGDIITVSYRDRPDTADSATFGLADGRLTSYQSVYLRGSEVVLFLHEPDLDLDGLSIQSYSLDLIGWYSDIAEVSMGPLGKGTDGGAVFDPEPAMLEETGYNTGVFKVAVEIPYEIGGQTLESGEKVELEYLDWGPAGADYVGDNEQDSTHHMLTTDLDATVELDQQRYTWTDRVRISIIAPDYNIDPDTVDVIGDVGTFVNARTLGDSINMLVYETGPDTGIFSKAIVLGGFLHDADGDHTTGDNNGNDVGPGILPTDVIASGPARNIIYADREDGISVVFSSYTGDSVIASSLINWNFGTVEWIDDLSILDDTGRVRIIDYDMNWDSRSVDTLKVAIFSDSSTSSIPVTLTETNEATGIFEGVVQFGLGDGEIHAVAGDKVTAVYEDNTLPLPYAVSDSLDISASSVMGDSRTK